MLLRTVNYLFLWAIEKPWRTVSHNQRVNLHFPTDFLWISYGFPMDFLWISYGFPMDFLWISYGSPMDFLWISYGSHGLSNQLGHHSGLHLESIGSPQRPPHQLLHNLTLAQKNARQGAETAPHAEPWRAVRPRQADWLEKKWEIHHK